IPDSTVVIPIILSSDKINLTNYGSNRVAWLVYLSIYNLPLNVRLSRSLPLFLLLTLLLVVKLETVANRFIVLVLYADGGSRKYYPRLALYIIDFPE
ncbi:hypothetical protein EJ05DRAFT_436202, partial [Pseudovirgaria hyperparasitica]